MENHAERILVGAAIGVLGALAFGIKLAEAVAATWRAVHDDDEPPVMNTQTNGGVKAGRPWVAK